MLTHIATQLRLFQPIRRRLVGVAVFMARLGEFLNGLGPPAIAVISFHVTLSCTQTTA